MRVHPIWVRLCSIGAVTLVDTMNTRLSYKTPSQFIADVIAKDKASVQELAALAPEYTPPAALQELHKLGEDALSTLEEMNQILRSAVCICERRGESTDWEAFAGSIRKLGLSGVTARTYRKASL